MTGILMFGVLAILVPGTPASAAPCAELNSLSPDGAAAGEILELHGKFGAAQEQKRIFFNGPGMYFLEPVSWSETIVKARLPKDAAPGEYAVGVYCNPMSDGRIFSSGSLRYNIKGAAVKISAPAPVETQTASSAARVTTAAKEDSRRLKLWAIGIIASVLLFVLFRRISERRIALPESAVAPAPEKRYYTLVQPDINQVDGVEFAADMLSDETVTIEIDVKNKFDAPFELLARDGNRPPLPPGERGRICGELLALGANAIDAGYNTNRVAAEFPAAKMPVAGGTHPSDSNRKLALDREMLEKTIRLLARLRDSKSVA